MRRKNAPWLGAAVVAGLVLWVAAPIAAISWLTVSAANANIEEPQVVFASVEENAGDVNRPIALLLQWDQPTAVVAPAWGGLVQSIAVTSGSAVEDGTKLVTIDGIGRLAAVTSQPFARSLAWGDSGADVAQLNAWLRGRGISTPDSSTFGDATLIAVRELARSIGVPGADRVAAFDPAWVVYLTGPATVESVAMKVAAPAPSAGSDLFTLRSALTGATLVEASEVTFGAAAPEGGDEGQAVTPSVTAAANESLVVTGVEVPLAEDRQRVAEASLADLAPLVSAGAEASPAVLRLAAQSGQWVVPAASVLLDESGKSCLHVSEHDEIVRVPVTIMGVVSGSAVVEGDLDSDWTVAVYPPGVRQTCS